jgi:ubiquinone biosynthesis protein
VIPRRPATTWPGLVSLAVSLAAALPAALAVALSLLVSASATSHAQTGLPSPREHFAEFDSRAELTALLVGVSEESDLMTRLLIANAAMAVSESGLAGLRPDDMRLILQAVDFEKWRRSIVEIMVHESHVFEMFPDTTSSWIPLVHDCLVFFFDGFSRARLIDHIVVQMELPPDADAGERLLQLTDRSPTLQKLGQILARNQDVPEEFRRHLQILESDIQTTSHQELIAMITASTGEEQLAAYRAEFSDQVLAEASVGAVIRCRLQPPGEPQPDEAICKMVKPYAVAALDEELEILHRLTRFLEQHADHYGIGGTPVTTMFDDLRLSLAREIDIVAEQENFRLAADYYNDTIEVHVPELFGLSCPGATYMEFIPGTKIVDAHPGDAAARAQLARRLNDALTFDVIFSPQQVAVFHGDPHAGNVYVMHDDPVDPYRIVLLDWGLAGTLSRELREELVQMIVGVMTSDARRVHAHLDLLLREPLPDDRDQLREIYHDVDGVLRRTRGENVFARLGSIIGALAVRGHAIDHNLGLFIKSQITISGIVKELDPEFDGAQQLTSRLLAAVAGEWPARLRNTVWFPGWTARPYPTMLSNEDVRLLLFGALENGPHGTQLLLGGMPPGSGFVVGLGWRHALANNRGDFLVQGRLSHYNYRLVDAEVAFPGRDARRGWRAQLHGRYRDFKAVNYFGIGNHTGSSKSTFRMEERAVGGEVSLLPHRALAVTGRLGYLSTGLAGGTRPPSIETRYDTASIPGWEERPDYLVYGARIAVDWHDLRVRDVAAGIELGAERFDARRDQPFDFEHYFAAAKASLPLVAARHFVALRARLARRLAAGDDEVPFYLLETIGGAQTVRGHREYRWRDQRSAVLGAEYRWVFGDPLSITVFGDAGQVFADTDALALDAMHLSGGVGFRLRMLGRPAVRIDVAGGREGIKLHFGTGPDY